MSDTYLAVFVGSKTSPKMTAWNALSESEPDAADAAAESAQPAI